MSEEYFTAEATEERFLKRHHELRKLMDDYRVDALLFETSRDPLRSKSLAVVLGFQADAFRRVADWVAQQLLTAKKKKGGEPLWLNLEEAAHDLTRSALNQAMRRIAELEELLKAKEEE